MEKCEVIQDLLPLYVDDVASKESHRIVEEHLKNCEKCNDVLLKMKNNNDNIPLKDNEDEIGVLKMIKKKVMQRHAMVAILTALILVAAIISLAIYAVGAKASGVDFWVMGAIVGTLIIINIFFGLYNLKITQRIKELNKLQYGILLILNILNTGNCVIHLVVNIILGAYKRN